MNRTQKKWLIRMSYVLILLGALLPIFGNYLLNVGCMEAWVDWIGDLNAEWEKYACLFWQMYQIVVQLGTLLLTLLLMTRVLGEAMDSPAVLIGTGLYMSNQYRWYVCYELGDLSQALVLMLIPLAVWSLWRVFQKKNLSSVGIAFIVCMSIGITATFVLPVGQQILMQADVQALNGYELGNLFTCYQVQNGCPGMGLGALLALIIGGWLFFVKGEKQGRLTIILLICVGVLTGATLLGTSAICWGIAQCGLSVLGAGTVKRAMKQENFFIRWGVPVIVFFACVGMLFYQGNGLVHYMEPLELAALFRI